jgi:hypothetical protein
VAAEEPTDVSTVQLLYCSTLSRGGVGRRWANGLNRGKKRGHKPFSSDRLVFGRPGERRELSIPNALAVRSVQRASPYGWPRSRARRSAASSASVWAWFTQLVHRVGISTGQGESSMPIVLRRSDLVHSELHRQSCALLTRLARRALRSTYRQTPRK